MFNLNKILLCICVIFLCCGQAKNREHNKQDHSLTNGNLINESGKTIETRFKVPDEYERKTAAPGSFAAYLRALPLKPAGTKVKFYNGSTKDDIVYDAVVDMEIGQRDLQQCADAVMRLRGEYFYSLKQYDKISFTFNNGFHIEYNEWIKGNRIVVNGNKAYWSHSAEPSNTYKDFRNFMDVVFTYAGTLSLSKTLKPKDIKNISIGDVFIRGGTPGHAVIVVDVAENKEGKKVFLLAQSYMPAQETQILKNPNNDNFSPWYEAKTSGDLTTPQWTFSLDELKTWE